MEKLINRTRPCIKLTNKQLKWLRTGKGETIIRFLELKGYLVTTEMGQKDLYAKPTGYKRTFYGYKYDHQFCVGHANEIEKKDERE